MINRLLFLLTGLCLLAPVSSQVWRTESAVNEQAGNNPPRGEVKVYRDPRLDDMVNRHISANRDKGGVNGYRIQVFFGSGRSGRDGANEANLQALSSFPDLKVHIIYQYSNYKVRIGDFRTKNDAYQWFHGIRRKFPNAYIVPDVIEIPGSR